MGEDLRAALHRYVDGLDEGQVVALCRLLEVTAPEVVRPVLRVVGDGHP